jgi:hypothetical protein
MQKWKIKQKLGEKHETRNEVLTITFTAQLAKEKMRIEKFIKDYPTPAST